jgi:peptide/nickel transport system ATP-binding protein
MSAILEVVGLCLKLEGNSPKTLVSDLSFSLEEGKILGIVGESGSGKSLTALSITRLLPENISISSGKVLFNNSGDIVELSSPEIKNIRRFRGKSIAMIFQEPMTSLNPSMRCGKQIEEAIQAHRKINSRDLKDKVISLLKEVDLPRPEILYTSYPHQLSGGQRQRLMIAMALSADPKVLIADEPTTALDVTVQKNIILLLKSLKENRGLSIIFISHDLRLIREISDHVLVMRNGKVSEYAPAEKLFSNPESSYTRGLIACQPPLDNKPDRLLTIADFETNEGKTNAGCIKKDRKTIDYSLPPILKIENLSVLYNVSGGFLSTKKSVFKAVNNVSLEVYPGETLGLVGESGCGKTTIGKAVLKLIKNQHGSIFFRGEKITSLTGIKLEHFRKSVQVVFQDPFSSLNPRQTVHGMLNEALQVHKPELNSENRRLKIAELLISVGLKEDDMYKYPHQFSGGQRQRISIARSLTPEPKLLVLDESVSALDVSVQAQVLNLLNDLKEKYGLSYLFISHDLSVVKYMSDRIVVMREGVIEETGEPQQIFNKPEKEYTRLLISSIPGYQYSSASTS